MRTIILFIAWGNLMFFHGLVFPAMAEILLPPEVTTTENQTQKEMSDDQERFSRAENLQLQAPTAKSPKDDHMNNKLECREVCYTDPKTHERVCELLC